MRLRCFVSGNVALRGEAALKARLPKEAKNSAAISPCERALPEETHGCSELVVSAHEVEESNLDCTGELMQCTGNGNNISRETPT